MNSTTDNPQQLKARAIIAGDLYHEGRIERTECFRLEVDAAVGRDSGPVKFKQNRDYAEWLEEMANDQDQRPPGSGS